MSSPDYSWYLRELREEVRNLFTYHKDELQWYLLYIVGIIVSAAWIVDMWNRAWDRGITWHVINSIVSGVPSGWPNPLVVPLFMILGLTLIFPFDQYKRLQGSILVVGISITGFMITYFNRIDITWQMSTIGLAIVSTGLGLYAGYRLGGQDSAGLTRYDNAFSLLKNIVLGVSIWGFIEAHLTYTTPYVLGRGWVGIDITPIGFESNLPLINEPTTWFFAALITLADIGAIIALTYILSEFTDYELNENAIIIGPDRAGKTWLMGGAAYSLFNEAAQGSQKFNPVPSIDDGTNELENAKNAFSQQDFDGNELKPTNSLRQFRLRFNYGLVAKREVTVQCLDYPGEAIKQASFEGQNKAKEDYTDTFSLDDDQSYEDLTFDELTTAPSQSIKQKKQIGVLLSAAVAKADTVGMVVPMDDFVTGFSDSDLPSYLRASDLDKSRQTSRSLYLSSYADIIGNYGQDKDVFFIPTMSDTLLEKYQGNPLTKADWPGFRRTVWAHVSLQHSNSIFDPGVHLDMGKYHPNTSRPGPVYPLYFQGHPDRQKSQTKNGKFKPKLDWNDQRYPLRGLRELLKALGR